MPCISMSKLRIITNILIFTALFFLLHAVEKPTFLYVLSLTISYYQNIVIDGNSVFGSSKYTAVASNRLPYLF